MMDAMDKAAGLTPNHSLYRARRLRPEFVEGAELCRLSVLTPQHGLGFTADMRMAAALRIAVLNEDKQLTESYRSQLVALAPASALLSFGEGMVDLAEPLKTIARHVDKVTLTPREAGKSDIDLLVAAGLSNPQIVALSELIAFVNFQTRVATGLRLMRLA
jgi:uncharacterized protein YciW